GGLLWGVGGGEMSEQSWQERRIDRVSSIPYGDAHKVLEPLEFDRDQLSCCRMAAGIADEVYKGAAQKRRVAERTGIAANLDALPSLLQGCIEVVDHLGRQFRHVGGLHFRGRTATVSLRQKQHVVNHRRELAQ